MPQKRSNRSVDELVDIMVRNTLSNMFTFLMARVVAFYPEAMRADVQPLIITKNIEGRNVENSITTDLPIIFPNSKDIYVRTPLVKGDLVLVGYSTVALDEILSSNAPVLVNSKRRFSQKDGIVLGGYRFDSGAQTLTGESESIVIHRRSTNTVIKITPAGDVIVTGANQCSVQCKSSSIEASADISLKASSISLEAPSVSIKASNTDVSGKLAVAGESTFTSKVTAGQLTTKAGKDMDTHTHRYNPGPGEPTETSGPS